MSELRMRSIAIKIGKNDEFQQLVEELLSTAREQDSEMAVFSGALDESAKTAGGLASWRNVRSCTA